MRAHMAIIFRTSQNLFSGGRVEIICPEVYKLSCLEADGFRALSVPGIQICDDSGSGLRLTLNDTLVPGDYAFVVGLTNPAYTPARNLFSVLLRDRSANVIDARMHIEGSRIVQ